MEVEAPAAAPAEPQPEAVGTGPADEEPMEEATQQGRFIEKVNTLFVPQVIAGGGPTKWLLGKLDTDECKHSFTYWLWDVFPEKDDVFYQRHVSLETVKSEEELKNNSNFLSVHPAMLGYEPGCTLKPPIGSAKFIAILDQLMIDGFVTGTEPLLINLPDAIHNNRSPPWGAHGGLLPPHSLGFIKGNARVSTLLALLCFAMDQGFEKADHPTLYESVRDIKVVRFSTGGMLGDALLNMKWSVRGSIRTQNNVLQIAVMVQNLQKAGACVISTFVSRWNLQSASSSKITGKRAASLRLLFESAPKDALNNILSHTEDSVGA